MLKILKSITGALETLILKLDYFYYPATEVLKAIAETIEANPNLHDISISEAGEDHQLLYDASSKLLNLTHLSFLCGCGRDYDPEVPSIGRTFSSLSTFRADLGTQSFPNVLRSLPVSALQDLTLWSSSSQECSISSLGPVGHFVNLKTLDVSLFAEPHIWEGVLRHILPCVQLESLRVSTPRFATHLTDSMLETIAQAWPCLQHLSLFPKRGEPPSATLQGLACFAKFCPAMKTLKIGVDASDLPEEAQMPLVGSALTELDFAVWSKLNAGEEDKIADFISRMWPNQQRKHPKSLFSMPGWAPVWLAVNARLESGAGVGL